MKKSAALLLLLLADSSFMAVHSQLKFGIKAGAGISRLSGYEGDSRAVFHAGLTINNTINTPWHFQAELLYSGEGQSYIVNTGEVDMKRTIALGYVQLPLLMQYYPSKQFYIESGPQIGVLACAANKGPGGDHVKVKRSYGNTSFAWDLGLGINTKKQFGFYARYSFGLSDITRYNNITDHSQVGEAGIMYQFKQTKRNSLSR